MLASRNSTKWKSVVAFWNADKTQDSYTGDTVGIPKGNVFNFGPDVEKALENKIHRLEDAVSELHGEISDLTTTVKDLISIIKNMQEENKKPNPELEILREQTRKNTEFTHGIVTKLINAPVASASQVVEKIVEKEVEADYSVDDALTKFTPEEFLSQIPLKDILAHGRKRAGR